jgi:hypothetical protein
MIKYTLVCDASHEFESWFPGSESYEEQARRGFVQCPFCQSTKVSKAIMAPNVARKDRDAVPVVASAPAVPAAASPPQTVTLLDERQQHLRAMIRDLHEKIVASSDDVGESFPEEARKMHDGETPVRSIRGKASFEEARSLLDEGIPVMPIPDLPEERN